MIKDRDGWCMDVKRMNETKIGSVEKRIKMEKRKEDLEQKESVENFEEETQIKKKRLKNLLKILLQLPQLNRRMSKSDILRKLKVLM